jgi:hypothetical protein
MTKDTNLKEELLKQGQSNGTMGSITGVKSIQQVIAKDEARVARMKKLTILTWVLVVVCFAGAGLIALMPGTPQEFLPVLTIVVGQGLFIIAVTFTVSLYVRSRTLTMHQIQASLANIEALLRETLQDK